MLKSKIVLYSISLILSVFILGATMGCGGNGNEDFGLPLSHVQPAPSPEPPPAHYYTPVTLPVELSFHSIIGDTSQCTIFDSVFAITVQAYNSDLNHITYTLPAGVQFIPDSPDAQIMMLLQDYTMEIGPGIIETFCLPVYCLNEELDAPSPIFSYKLGGIVTGNSCMDEIRMYATGKSIDLLESIEIQYIIWDCLRNGYITSDDRAMLASL